MQQIHDKTQKIAQRVEAPKGSTSVTCSVCLAVSSLTGTAPTLLVRMTLTTSPFYKSMHTNTYAHTQAHTHTCAQPLSCTFCTGSPPNGNVNRLGHHPLRSDASNLSRETSGITASCDGHLFSATYLHQAELVRWI